MVDAVFLSIGMIAVCGFFMIGGVIADKIDKATGGDYGVYSPVHK